MIDTMVKHKPMPNVKCEFDMQNELRPIPQVRRCDNSKAHSFNSLTLIIVRCSLFVSGTAYNKSANYSRREWCPIAELSNTSIEHNELLLRVSEKLCDKL